MNRLDQIGSAHGKPSFLVHATLMLATLLLTACGSKLDSDASPSAEATIASEAAEVAPTPAVIATATPFSAVDLAACLEIARGQREADEEICPGFISTSASEAMAVCKDVGGALVAAPQPSMQSLDVNGDGVPEYLYDFRENFGCDGAPSVFSCGSLGCPTVLYEKRDDAWFAIGAFRGYDSLHAELMTPEGESIYGVVREGCGGERPCDELWYYRWDGSAYQRSTIEVRGHVVEFDNEGLWTLASDAPVLAEPLPDAPILDSYSQGTTVVVIGHVRDTSFKYVSPCNACERGFVDGNALQKSH